jgi:hypothetical protein
VSRRLEKSLEDSLKRLPRADLDIIINADISKAEQHDYITRQETRAGSGTLARAALTAAFSVIIISAISVWLIGKYSVYTVVNLDVNAGFIITADSDGEVLNTRGVDENARIILRDLDYDGVGVEELASAIVAASAERSYFTEEKNCILVSVWDTRNAQGLLAGITERLTKAANAVRINPSILGQYLDRDGELEEIAERYGVTPGRLQLIDTLRKYKPVYSTEQLVRYDIESLLKIADAADITLPVSGYRAADVEPVIERDTLPRIASKPDVELPIVKVHSKRPTPAPTATRVPAPVIKPPETQSAPEPEPTEAPPVPTDPPTEPETAPPEPAVSPAEPPESLWASIAEAYEETGRRQLDFWRGSLDDQAWIDREFDELQEKAAELGEEYKELASQYREYYQSQYESIIDEKEWTS